MKLKVLTWESFAKFEPCYSPVERYGEFSGTILDILNDERIPDEDKLWAATREGILDDKTLRLFACGCVREVWDLLEDDRSRNAVVVAEKYAHGECSVDELNAARDAAWAAAMAAAWAAARDAAGAAAMSAGAAAMSAWAAAMAPVRDAAWAAAMDAAWINQLEILKNLIKTNYEI